MSDRPDPPGGRILGVDYGRRRVGIAVSDPTGVIATGVTVLDASPALAAEICRLAARLGAAAVVVGMPVTLRGARGQMAEEVGRFIADLERACGLPVTAVDERYTSAEARDTQIALGVPRMKRRRRGEIDRMAAALILQSYLDERRPPEVRPAP